VYSSQGDSAQGAALAQERYYESHGEAAPLTIAQSPIDSDDTPWPSVVLGLISGLAIVAAGAVQLRRVRIRRRTARVAT
jgi:hypothetical protein